MSNEKLRLEILEDEYELRRLKTSVELCEQKIARKKRELAQRMIMDTMLDEENNGDRLYTN